VATIGPTGLTLSPVHGEAYSMVVTITDGKNRWATLGACEARMQVRVNRAEAAALVDDLTARLTTAYGTGGGVNDLIVTLTLTGAQTRALTGPGVYDLFVSDTGTTDAQSIRAAWGKWEPVNAVTTAS
jgi:hypothetical protein